MVEFHSSSAQEYMHCGGAAWDTASLCEVTGNAWLSEPRARRALRGDDTRKSRGSSERAEKCTIGRR